MIRKEVVRKVYNRYRRSTNMSYAELRSWSKDPCSYHASLDRSPINRNLELLRTPVHKWRGKHVRWAKRTISFNNRMRNVRQGKSASRSCTLSKRDLALKNWAWNPKK